MYSLPGLSVQCVSVYASDEGLLHSLLLIPLLRLFVLVNRHCNKKSEKAHKYFSVELKERGEQEKDAEGTNDDKKTTPP